MLHSRSEKSILSVGKINIHKNENLKSLTLLILLKVPDNHEYRIPEKAVKTPADMQIWEKSEAYNVSIFIFKPFFQKIYL